MINEALFENKPASYQSLEEILYTYTDGFTKEEGEYPLDTRKERDEASLILQKYYNNVEKNTLDYGRKNEDGTVDYKVKFSDPKNSEGIIPDKDPENFNQFVDDSIDSPVFEALVESDLVDDELIHDDDLNDEDRLFVDESSPKWPKEVGDDYDFRDEDDDVNDDLDEEYEVPDSEYERYKNWLIRVDRRINKDNVDEYAADGELKYTWRDMQKRMQKRKEADESNESLNESDDYFNRLLSQAKVDSYRDFNEFINEVSDAQKSGTLSDDQVARIHRALGFTDEDDFNNYINDPDNYGESLNEGTVFDTIPGYMTPEDVREFNREKEAKAKAERDAAKAARAAERKERAKAERAVEKRRELAQKVNSLSYDVLADILIDEAGQTENGYDAYDLSKDEVLQSLRSIMTDKEILKKYHKLFEDLDEAIEKHDDLNRDIFGEDDKLLPEVREKLLEIAARFTDNLKEDGIVIEPKDIVLLGSNASYNYTDASDLDTHIVADMSAYEGQEDLALKLYQAYKSLFNQKFDPMIKGHEAEIYVEPDKVSANSNGIYSIMHDEWLKEPDPDTIPEVDMEPVNAELQPFIDKFNEIKENPDEESIDKLIDSIYLLRQSSILQDGEYSTGNLVFKEFRNQGLLQELKDMKVELQNKEMSLESLDEAFRSGPLARKSAGKDVLYVIKDRQGNQLSSPNPDDNELWDRVESRDPDGKRGLRVVVYTEGLNEDTVKQGDKWVNKGKEGTHGKFKTKKAADAQRKAMFANGYHENLDEAATNLVYVELKDDPGTFISKQIYDADDSDFLFTKDDEFKALFNALTWKEDLQNLLDEYADGYSVEDFKVYKHFDESLNEGCYYFEDNKIIDATEGDGFEEIGYIDIDNPKYPVLRKTDFYLKDFKNGLLRKINQWYEANHMPGYIIKFKNYKERFPDVNIIDESLTEGETEDGYLFGFNDPEDTLKIFLDWEGIYGYLDDILMFAPDGYDAVDDYLEEEGIIGYTYKIMNILETGECFCRDMEEDDFEELCRANDIDPEENYL